MTPDVTAFFHDATSTISYLVSEPGGDATEQQLLRLLVSDERVRCPARHQSGASGSQQLAPGLKELKAVDGRFLSGSHRGRRRWTAS